MTHDEAQKHKPVTMVELEERLWTDHNGEFRAQCDAELSELEAKAALLLRQGSVLTTTRPRVRSMKASWPPGEFWQPVAIRPEQDRQSYHF